MPQIFGEKEKIPKKGKQIHSVQGKGEGGSRETKNKKFILFQLGGVVKTTHELLPKA